MTGKKIIFIINPISGNERGISLCKTIYKQLVKSRFSEIHFTFTDCKGAGSRLAKEALESGYTTIVAVGGDGTVNEVASTLVHTDVALGIIPCGSGNGLAGHLGISQNIRKAMDVINNGEIAVIDYGTANDIKFFCTFGMGFDAMVSRKFAESAGRGLMTYIESTLLEYFNFESEKYILECNGERIETTAFLITCANASQWGNNAYIAPKASVTDGLIDVMTMGDFHFIEAAPLAFQLFTKQIDKNHFIKMYRAKEFVFHRSIGTTYHFDGEPIEMGKSVTVRSIPAGLKVLVAKEKK